MSRDRATYPAHPAQDRGTGAEHGENTKDEDGSHLVLPDRGPLLEFGESVDQSGAQTHEGVLGSRA